MLKRKIAKIALLVGVIFACSIGSALAAVNLEPINAFLNRNLQFVLHGELWQPKDATGKKVSAITYEGSTYLPVRALAEALKVPIEYDAKSQKIVIGVDPGAKSPIFATPMEIDNIYVVTTKDAKEAFVKDKQYKQVLKIDQYGDVTFTLNRKYKRLVLDAAVVEPGEHEVEFTLYNTAEMAGNDNPVALSVQKVSPEDGVKQLIYDVEGLDKITIHVQSHNLNPYIYARILDTSYFDNGEEVSR